MVRGISFVVLTSAALAAGCVGDNPDASTPAPANEAGSNAPPNTGLVENGTFENGCGEPLFFSNGAMSSDPTAKTGAKSCKLCRTPGGEPSLYLYARLGNVKPKVGETYVVSAWMRKAPGIDSGGNSLIAIGGLDSGGSVNGDGEPTNGPDAITDVWKEATTTWTVKMDAAIARVDIGLPQAADNVCFLVDDLSVTLKK